MAAADSNAVIDRARAFAAAPLMVNMPASKLPHVMGYACGTCMPISSTRMLVAVGTACHLCRARVRTPPSGGAWVPATGLDLLTDIAGCSDEKGDR